MAKSTAIPKFNMAFNTNAEGRLRGWDDENLRFDGSESTILKPSRERASTVELKHFGSVNGFDSSQEDLDASYNPEPIAKMIRRKRPTSLAFFKEIFGF